MRRVAWAVLAAAGAAAPRAVDVARYERQAARFMADAGGGRRLGGGAPSDGPADAIDPNWELVKKSLEGLNRHVHRVAALKATASRLFPRPDAPGAAPAALPELAEEEE